MNRWKVLFCFVACSGFLQAEEVDSLVEESNKETVSSKKSEPIRNSLIHFDWGSGPYPLPIPVLSVGYRKQSGHQGIDLSLHASSILFFTQVKLSLSYLFYFIPSLKGQIYIGPGIGGSMFLQRKASYDKAVVALAPEVIVGKEYIGRTGSRRLIQMQVSVPTYTFGRIRSLKKNQRVIHYPLIVVSYGICF